MPSLGRARSLFGRKGRGGGGGGNPADDGGYDASKDPPPGSRATPPTPDPDGSTASHSSNENYVSPRSATPKEDPPATPMSASQFKTHSDEEMDKKNAALADRSPNVLPKRKGKGCQTKSREGVPIVTSGGADHFSPSAVSSEGNFATEGFYSKSKKTFGGKERPKVRPSARCSAFGGAPRYDWMDIETTAAIKIQAAYRRLQTQNRLDELGLSTPGMRNRRAQRRARYQSRMSRHVVNADVPFPFNMCGVGLLFGDGTFEDEKVVDTLEKRRADKAKREHEMMDAEKRRFRMKKKESQHMEEGIEVVESFEGEDAEGGEGAEGEGAGEKGSRKKGLGRMGRSSRKNASARGSKSPKSPRSAPSSPRNAASRSKSKKLYRNQNDFDPEL